jgi:hypothetical protein
MLKSVLVQRYSREEALLGRLIADGRRWSAPKPTSPFIPARESGHPGFFT